MSIANYIRDKWCRFQGELFPEIQAAVGPHLKNHQRFVTVLEMVCPENFIRRIPQRDGRPLCDRVNWRGPFWQRHCGTFQPQEPWSNALRSTANCGTCADRY